MFNYYLYNPSYINASTVELEKNLIDLQTIFSNRKYNEYFLKHDSIWNTIVEDGNFADVVFTKFIDKQFSIQVLPQLLQQFSSIKRPIESIDEFNSIYKLYNAFYGISFPEDSDNFCIHDVQTYRNFFKKNFWVVTPRTFWARKDELFSRIVFCNNVESQILTIGASRFDMIIKKLNILDEYVKNNWKTGHFNYNHANLNSALNISPESQSTMQNKDLVDRRKFKLPDGSIECFELHIKVGSLRFHFFPKNFKIFIGYIGVHLQTSNF